MVCENSVGVFPRVAIIDSQGMLLNKSDIEHCLADDLVMFSSVKQFKKKVHLYNKSLRMVVVCQSLNRQVYADLADIRKLTVIPGLILVSDFFDTANLRKLSDIGLHFITDHKVMGAVLKDQLALLDISDFTFMALMKHRLSFTYDVDLLAYFKQLKHNPFQNNFVTAQLIARCNIAEILSLLRTVRQQGRNIPTDSLKLLKALIEFDLQKQELIQTEVAQEVADLVNFM